MIKLNLQMKAILNKIKEKFYLAVEYVEGYALYILEHDYSLFVGFLPIFYLIYRRFFRVRTPKSLILDSETITHLQVGLYIWLCLIFVVLLILYCKRRWFPGEQKEPSSFVDFWSYQWSLYLDRRAAAFNKLSKFFYVIPIRFKHNICTILLKYPPLCRYFVYLTYSLPRIIISTFFLLDVFYFQKFHYFYLSLYLLILPLIYRASVYILLQHHIVSFPIVCNQIRVTDMPTPDEPTRDLKRIEFVNPEGKSTQRLFDYYTYMYNPLYKLPYLLDIMDMIKKRVMFKVNPFIYLANIIGWGYLSYYGVITILLTYT